MMHDAVPVITSDFFSKSIFMVVWHIEEDLVD